MKFFQHLGVGIGIVLGALGFMNLERGTPPPQAAGTSAPSQTEENNTIQLNQVQFSFQEFEQTLIDSVDANKKSVVSIVASKDIQFVRGGRMSMPEVVTEEFQVGGGSGILIDERGYILTNKHVVDDEDARYTVLFYDGTTAETTSVRLDPILDIAVLAIDPTSLPDDTQPPRILGIQQPVHIGQFTYAIGNTLAEFQNSVTLGIISGKNRDINVDEGSIYAGLYQTDTAISMGNSGGPLFNLDGHVIAINTAVSSIGENIGFALPITQEFVEATLNQIIASNSIQRPFIGVRSRVMNTGLAQELDSPFTQGMLISDVVEGSPADSAGLERGDILLSIDGRAISEAFPLLYQLYTYQPGEEIEVNVGRGDEAIQLKLMLGVY